MWSATTQSEYDLRNVDLHILDPINQPTDTVSDIRFSPKDETIFACSTWDGKVIVYKILA